MENTHPLLPRYSVNGPWQESPHLHDYALCLNDRIIVYYHTLHEAEQAAWDHYHERNKIV